MNARDFAEACSLWAGMAIMDIRLTLLPRDRLSRYLFPKTAEAAAEKIPMPDPAARAEIARLAHLVAAAARYPLFFNMTCLRRSLVLRSRLARAGINSVLVFGARRDGPTNGMSAHVWLDSGGMKIDSYAAPKRYSMFE